jgi:hypothetical protein
MAISPRATKAAEELMDDELEVDGGDGPNEPSHHHTHRE